jgi:hypothetical protein
MTVNYHSISKLCFSMAPYKFNSYLSTHLYFLLIKYNKNQCGKVFQNRNFTGNP